MNLLSIVVTELHSILKYVMESGHLSLKNTHTQVSLTVSLCGVRHTGGECDVSKVMGVFASELSVLSLLNSISMSIQERINNITKVKVKHMVIPG